MPPTTRQVLIAVLVFLAVVCVGGAFLALGAARRRALRPRLFQGGIQDGPRVESLGFLNKVGATASMGKPTPRLQETLARAGYQGRNAPQVYLGAKMVLLVVGVLAMGMLLVPVGMQAPAKVLLALGAGAVLSFVPNLVVSGRRRARTDEARRALPHAADLLEICVSSGMGLDMAWNAVSDEIRHVSPVLADEMALTNLEVQLGAPRPVAMRHMAERTGVEEFSGLVALLLQSERFGTSIADSLRLFAGGMREDRSQRAEESAEKMSVKLLFPMVLFIFPAMLIVLVGPAGIRLFGAMSQ